MSLHRLFVIEKHVRLVAEEYIERCTELGIEPEQVDGTSCDCICTEHNAVHDDEMVTDDEVRLWISNGSGVSVQCRLEGETGSLMSGRIAEEPEEDERPHLIRMATNRRDFVCGMELQEAPNELFR